jgi:hypothetical protein
MEDTSKLIESLLQRTMEYLKTSYELVRLKTIDKVSDVISSFLPNLFVFALILSFFLFFNIGLAFWLGSLLEKPFLGFFIVSGFYFLAALVLYLFLYKRIKRSFYNFIIKRMSKK